METGTGGILLEDGSGVLLLEPSSQEDLTTTPDALDIVTLMTSDGGTIWYAFQIGKDMR